MDALEREILKRIATKEQEMERLLKDFFVSKNPMLMLTRRCWVPHTDVYETPNDVVVRVEVAGADREDLHVRLAGDTLLIRGRRSESLRRPDANFLQMEIYYGYFERILVIPEPIDPNSVRASYRNGILEIIMPKAARREESIPIEVESAVEVVE